MQGNNMDLKLLDSKLQLDPELEKVRATDNRLTENRGIPTILSLPKFIPKLLPSNSSQQNLSEPSTPQHKLPKII
jgi:hypothetical protein